MEAVTKFFVDLKDAVLNNWQATAIACIVVAVMMGFITGIEFPTMKKGQSSPISSATAPAASVAPSTKKGGRKKAEPVVVASPVVEDRGRPAAGGKGRSPSRYGIHPFHSIYLNLSLFLFQEQDSR